MPAMVAFTHVTPETTALLALPAPNCGSFVVAKTPIWLLVSVPPEIVIVPVLGRFHSSRPYTVPVTLFPVQVTPTALSIDDNSMPKLVLDAEEVPAIST